MDKVENFFEEIHQDYKEIIRDKKLLRKPLLWSLTVQILDTTLVLIAFWSLGYDVNPAIVLVGYGLSSIVSIFSGTLGGTGIYEAVMVAFLATAGSISSCSDCRDVVGKSNIALDDSIIWLRILSSDNK